MVFRSSRMLIRPCFVTMNKLDPLAEGIVRQARRYVFETGAHESLGGTQLYDQLGSLLPKPVDQIPIYPGVGVGMFVIRPGTTGQFEFLLMRRRNADGWGDGQWSLPGGKIDWFEDAEEAARRETYEETGLIVTGKLMKLGYTDDKWPKNNKHYITLYFAGRAHSDKWNIREPLKCDSMHWVSIDAIGGTNENLFTGIKEIKSENYMKLCSEYSQRD